jgi:hypothetical protein
MRNISFIALAAFMAAAPAFAATHTDRRVGNAKALKTTKQKSAEPRSGRTRNQARAAETAAEETAQETLYAEPAPAAEEEEAESSAEPEYEEEIIDPRDPLAAAIKEASACRDGIAGDLNTIYALTAGSTAAGGLGTLAAGGALGTGIAKGAVDKRIKDNKKILDEANALKTERDALRKIIEDIQTNFERLEADKITILPDVKNAVIDAINRSFPDGRGGGQTSSAEWRIRFDGDVLVAEIRRIFAAAAQDGGGGGLAAVGPRSVRPDDGRAGKAYKSHQGLGGIRKADYGTFPERNAKADRRSTAHFCVD